MLQHILANFRQPGSYSLALQWLYSLFVAYSQVDISAQHEAAASAHVNAPQVSPLPKTLLSNKHMDLLRAMVQHWHAVQGRLRSGIKKGIPAKLRQLFLVQLRAALASALDDGDMVAGLAGRSDQLQPSLSSPADQESSAEPAAARAEAPIKADQPSEMSAAQGAINRIGDNQILPVKMEQDDSSAGLQVEVSATSAAIEVPQGTDRVQDVCMNKPESSGRNHAADLAGTLYETVLLAILEGLRSALSDGGLPCCIIHLLNASLLITRS